MTTETVETPSSVAGAAMFGSTETPAPAAAPEATDPPAELAAEEQAAADAAKAAEAGETDEAPAIKRPGKDATPEEWAEFYKLIGAPDAADAYEVTLPEGGNEAEIPLIQQMFKEANILPEQAKVLLDFRNKMFAEQNAAAEAAEKQRITDLDNKNKAEATELSREWGSAETANKELARRGVTQFIPGDQAKQLEVISSMEAVLGYKETMKFWHNIGQSIGEHDAPGLGSNNEQRKSSKSTAEVLYPSTAGN
jgi:hypothetical protein